MVTYKYHQKQDAANFCVDNFLNNKVGSECFVYVFKKIISLVKICRQINCVISEQASE
jgi:hypothetical protein